MMRHQRRYIKEEEEEGDDDDDLYDLGNAQDLEKHEYHSRESSIDYENELPSSYSESSRQSSGSHKPMLRKPLPRKSKSRYLYHLPHKITRYLCLALMSTIIIFILSLVRMSWAESRALESGPVRDKTPQAPPWENFVFLKRYYGGIRTLISRKDNVPEYPTDHETFNITSSNTSITARPVQPSTPFIPYPDYTSSAYIQQFGSVHECSLGLEDSTKIPSIQAYSGVPQGLPDVVTGSHRLLGLRDDICFERYGKLAPYGFGYSLRKGGIGAGLDGDRVGAESVWAGLREIDYTHVKWNIAQEECLVKNSHRFKPKGAAEDDMFQSVRIRQIDEVEQKAYTKIAPSNTTHSTSTHSDMIKSPQSGRLHLPRTAIVIRTWWDYDYTPESILYLRSLVAELSLLSGGEYTVHFLVHVKDDNSPVWADQETHDRILENALPKEFHGMGTLWSERQMGLVYGGLAETFVGDLPVHGVYRSSFMPLQYFAHKHPEYDYFWNWEMDVRYTGHWYHLFDKLGGFARDQPRKGLWERSGRFYVPTVHGTWEDFKQMVRVQTEMVVENKNNMWANRKPGQPSQEDPTENRPIWGPHGPDDMLRNIDDPVPPTSYEKDKYIWGVGEEADLITLNPIFDPDGTTWTLAEDITGYNTTEGLPPRRAAIITTSRLSRRLLANMHREVALGRHTMFSEMWPATCALHHGLKAVYAPHPMYIDRDWPTQYLANVLNAGKNGAVGGARTSVIGDREHNFKGMTWFYNAGHAPNVWRRWLGYRVDNEGGEEAELAGEGRMCLPGVLLHPVKEVQLVIEGTRDGELVLDKAKGGDDQDSPVNENAITIGSER